MRTSLRIVFLCLLAPAAAAFAEDKPATDGPLAAHAKMVYGGMKKILLRSAEVMPEEHYGFRPAESVRTFGQIVGHVADSQYVFCSGVLGEKKPTVKIEKTTTSKAELIVALKDAFAYCDRAYDGLTDASATAMVKHMGADTPKLGALTVNTVHTVEHYGNLVTYMRMKNIVPPTSDQAFMQQLMSK
jgi:uncharacterized damage-inducible protein DinB